MPKPRKENIFLMGDRPLLREFGEICHKSGYAVSCKTNPGAGKLPMPKFLSERRAVPAGTAIAVELTNGDPERKKENLILLDRSLPRSVTILSSSVTITIGRQSGWVKRPERLAGLCALPTLVSQRLIELAAGPSTTKNTMRGATDFVLKLGRDFAVVQDRVGMVMPRILCMLINEAFFALGEGIASPNDLDTAMRLGTNYPQGPVRWAEAIGIPEIVGVLDALREDLGEERYRVAPVLRQMASRTPGRQS